MATHDNPPTTLLSLVHEFARRASAQVDLAARRLGLTARETFALLEIQREKCNQERLACKLAINRNAVVELMDRMSIHMYAVRQNNEKNRREKLLILLPRGEAKLKELARIVPEMREQLLAGLNEQEKAQFLRLLKKVMEGDSNSSFEIKGHVISGQTTSMKEKVV